MSVKRRFTRARIAAQLASTGRLGAGHSTTGFKLFVALMLALLPLGVVAVIGTVQTIRTVEMERVAGLNLAAAEGASRLLGEINADRSTMRLVANDLAAHPRSTAICQRASNQLRGHDRDFGFAMFDGDGRPLCHFGTVPRVYDAGGATLFDQQATIVEGARHLLVRVNSMNGAIRGLISYGPQELGERTGLRDHDPGFVSLTLHRGHLRLPLTTDGARPDPADVDRAVAPLNLGGLQLAMTTQRPPVDLLRFAATILPIVMWFAAAAVGWWVVNRYLIRPLIGLNRYVAAYQPGTMLGPLPDDATLAQEIRTLGETFREISEDVVEHEGQLADALVHQRALTREVHHRVKNNLQIIASLINLHSRASPDPAAAEAYASIQRRVDALSVVHRNHYASAEYSAGIDAQALISELASGLRGSAPGRQLAIKVAADHLHLSQDTAVPTAFLITELVELAILSGRSSPVLVALRRDSEEPDKGELSIASDSLRPDPDVEQLLEERFGRVLTGLSRQLRAPLEYVPGEGRYSIRLAVR
ncbi:sensor histidine kinase [Sphingobium sufflavum]|uniref:sensor histidine kinase n=1 Tax=Sphingobium sufflavum TaxID=1129547 RepID=UPI001F22BF48|nr:sensor histidine kinase [Sphingobium sufflavum]MCE7795499.1 sensor histidine kinase [Sphingobium sufflavum]